MLENNEYVNFSFEPADDAAHEPLGPGSKAPGAPSMKIHAKPPQKTQALVVFPPLLTAKAVRPPRRRAPGGIPAGGWRAEVVAPHGLVDTRASGRPQVAPTTSAQATDHSLGLLLPTRPAAQPLGSRGGPIPISAEVFQGHGTSGGPAGQGGTAHPFPGPAG